MICRNSLALIALALMSLPASVNAGSTEKIRNQQVVALRPLVDPAANHACAGRIRLDAGGAQQNFEAAQRAIGSRCLLED